MKATTLLLLLCGTLLLLATCGWCRRPLIRAPRNAPTTGHYTVVLRKGLTREEYVLATAKISQIGKVHGHTDRLLKTVTVEVSPYALETVSLNNYVIIAINNVLLLILLLGHVGTEGCDLPRTFAPTQIITNYLV